MSIFARRLGPDPHANGAHTAACDGCPDILELQDGDFAIIGTDITDEAQDELNKAERKLEREQRGTQQAFAQANGLYDRDLGRRCMAITDAVEDEIKQIKRKLFLVEESL